MNYYVNAAHPSASDTNSGQSDDVPFKTFKRGLTVVSSGGHTLRVRNSIYRESLGEVSIEGTLNAPVLVSCDPGVIVRPTTVVTSTPTLHSGNVYWLPSATATRLVETNESGWQPITVADPNGVTFQIARPVPYHPVTSLALVEQVPGSCFWVPMEGRVYFRTFGRPPADCGLEYLTSLGVSWRSTYTTIDGLTMHYASQCQVYEADSVTLTNLRLHATPLLISSGAHNTVVRGAVVEHVITRGLAAGQYLWHDSGSGTGLSIDRKAVDTVLENVLVRYCWNGPVFGGQYTRVTHAECYGFPNHGLSASGRGGTLSHVKASNAQEGLWCQNADQVTLEHCDITGALCLGGGHTITKAAATNLTLFDNRFRTSKINASADSIGLRSDHNLWVTPGTDWDVRLNGLPIATSWAAIQALGIEAQSCWMPF